MKKSIAYGIILFFVGSFMMGCGKSSKSASNPTPVADTTNNVTNLFNGNTSSTLNVHGKTFVVTNASAFQDMLSYNGYSNNNGLNFINTGYGYIDALGNCVAGVAFSYGINQFFNWLGTNNSNVNVGGTCVLGSNNGINGINGTQGTAVANGQAYSTTINATSTYFRSAITLSSGSIFSFDAQKTGSYYYDAAKRVLVAGENGSTNKVVLYFNNGSTLQSNTLIRMGEILL